MPPKMRPAATITRGSREDSAVPGFREHVRDAIAGPGEGRIRTSLKLTGALLDRRDVDRIREVLAQPELHQVAA